VRSDFGETLAYVLLEDQFGTLIGYKGVRDRETIQQVGRGIDIVGVEEGDPLLLLLGEVKVSDESASPPQVVDKTADCLQVQHLKHIGERQITAKKIWDQSRHVTDKDIRDRLFTAALYFESERWDKLQLISCSVLVRPEQKYSDRDFGSFRDAPSDYCPARIRFIIFCVPGDSIESIIQDWYESINSTGAAA
jgi:hypothetical protein